MPLTLHPPRQGKSPNWTIRGTYLGVRVDRSSGTHKKPVAREVLGRLERAIERGEFPEKPAPQTGGGFVSAAVAYMKAGRSPAYVDRLVLHFQDTPLAEIDQAAIDAAAVALYPLATPATRNRKVYTPVSAILHHAGMELKLRRPKGAKGGQRTAFLSPQDAGAIIQAAEQQEPAFALLLTFLLYTGVRIGEAMALRWEDVSLPDRLAYIPTSKNDDPRTLLLRAELRDALAAHRGDREHGRVFPFAKGGGLKDRLTRAKLAACGIAIPKRRRGETAADRRVPPHRLAWVTFHTFRHTWATWLRRYGGADLQGLVATGNWRDPRSAARYAHVHADEEWGRVERLPGLKVAGGKDVE